MVKRRSKPGASRRPFRKSGYSRARRYKRKFRKLRFNKTITGIPPRKFIKVRKDFNLTFPATTGGGWNSLLVGGAQVGMLEQAFGYFYGSSVTPVSIAVGALDPTMSAGLVQWNNFYNRLICLGSKITVDILNIGGGGVSDDVSLVTLVPTVGFNLASGKTGLIPFDAAGIDPAELPYAKRMVLNGQYAAGGSRVRIKNYCKIRRMIGVKNMEDVTNSAGDGPYIPVIQGNWATILGKDKQGLYEPSTGLIDGVYWNIIFQNMLQNSTIDATGGTVYTPSATVRVQVTSYCMMTDRIPLLTV